MKKIYLILGLALGVVSCGPKSNTGDTISTFSIVGKTSLEVGEVYKYTVEPNIDVTFESSDDLILTINSKGEATAFKEGTVTITATAKNDSSLKANLYVSVGIQLSIPKDSLGLIELINRASKLESNNKDVSIERTSSSINLLSKQSAKLYNDFYIEKIDESYKNYSGEINENATNFNGIYGNYYYSVSDSNKTSYGIKRKIVDVNPVDLEILRSEAKTKGNNPYYVSKFYDKFASTWGPRTKDLKITGQKDEKGNLSLSVSSIYLFLWADGISNDSAYYESSLFFASDGLLLNASFKETSYEENQYDAKTNKFVENAKVKETETIKYEATRGNKYDNNKADFNPEDYFVKSVTKANYNGDVHIGDYISSKNISLETYEGSKAVDTKDFVIVSVKNPTDQVVITKDTNLSNYVAVSSGKAYLTCQMTYSSDVKFVVEVNVLEAN